MHAHFGTSVADARLRVCNDRPLNPAGAFVLYWMTATRRLEDNYALDHAVDLARRLERPLLVFEALGADYPWASRRLHQFIVEGMCDNGRTLDRSATVYYPYVEPVAGAGRGLLRSLAASACALVTDDAPHFIFPSLIAAASEQGVHTVAVDSMGILPMSVPDRIFTTAYSFRRYLQKVLPDHALVAPRPGLEQLGRNEGGLSRVGKLKAVGITSETLAQWGPVESEASVEHLVAQIDFSHQVEPGGLVGGPEAAESLLNTFIAERLGSYSEGRNRVDTHGSSGLSPYLHFGHLGPHRFMKRVLQAENWTPARCSEKATGKRRGWWGASENAEGLLDQLITWREIGINMARLHPDYTRYDSLPSWALETLEVHRNDPREHIYSLDEFAHSRTHDPIWNYAQKELATTGRMNNYLRMLWGKKIVHWTPSPEAALSIMIELNNRYGYDGRDPNSYSGIFWCLGRYDRAWGPERPIFGKVRYMTSASTDRKLKVSKWISTRRQTSMPV